MHERTTTYANPKEMSGKERMLFKENGLRFFNVWMERRLLFNVLGNPNKEAAILYINCFFFSPHTILVI